MVGAAHKFKMCKKALIRGKVRVYMLIGLIGAQREWS